MGFTMQLYSTHHDNSIEDIGDLRWFLFSKHNLSAERLPPTWGSLQYHVLHSHCVANSWHQSIMYFDPDPLDPLDSGWYMEGNRLMAIMTCNLPAPEASIDLSVCNCKSGKTKCTSGNCRCHKNGLKYTDMCNCKDFENTDEFIATIDIDSD